MGPMLNSVSAIRGRAAARATGSSRSSRLTGHDDVFVLFVGGDRRDGGPATRTDGAAPDGHQPAHIRVLPNGNGDRTTGPACGFVGRRRASPRGARTGGRGRPVPAPTSSDAAGRQGELTERAGIRPNTVSSVLRGDPISTRTLEATPVRSRSMSPPYSAVPPTRPAGHCSNRPQHSSGKADTEYRTSSIDAAVNAPDTPAPLARIAPRDGLSGLRREWPVVLAECRS